jgi:quercetin dioxygenase-like cupin family protein/ribonuclease HI
MELVDSAGLLSRAEKLGDGARLASLYPASGAGGSLVAVDLLELQPGKSTPSLQFAEEHILYVLSGSGEARAGDGGPAALLRAGSVARIAPREAHTLTAHDGEQLRVLVVVPLLALSDRALGVASATVPAAPVVEQPAERHRVAEQPATPPLQPVRQPQQRPQPQPTEEDGDEPRPDISGLMRKASELSGQPRPERRRPAPEPEPEPEPAAPEVEETPEEEDSHKDLMELLVVFHGATRGTPGQGYGAYSVQSPGRRAIVKRAEFGPNYTVAQAEYETLLAGLQYIIERLTVTSRAPIQAALDIKTDSDSLVNQLEGHFKVKDSGLKASYTQAMELLDQFGAWQIEWQSTEETVKALGS